MEQIDLQPTLVRQYQRERYPQEYHQTGSFSGLEPLSRFSSLSLDELGDASLLDRQETKYTFRKDKLLSLLIGLESQYFILEIQGRRTFDYRSVYFDTPDRLFFRQHQTGALPRWKIRQRTYLNSGLSFLEIKSRDNRRITHKSRRPIPNPEIRFSKDDFSFIRTYFPGQVSKLIPTLETRYTRITLIHKNRQERITIDSQLRFSTGSNIQALPNLAVAEVKQNRLNPRSLFISQLKRSSIRPGSFSKYCIGSVLLHPEIKHNRFKPVLHHIYNLSPGEFDHERPQ